MQIAGSNAGFRLGMDEIHALSYMCACGTQRGAIRSKTSPAVV